MKRSTSDQKIAELVATLQTWPGGDIVPEIGIKSINKVRDALTAAFPGEDIAVKKHGQGMIITKTASNVTKH
jgi:hypothetical protein